MHLTTNLSNTSFIMQMAEKFMTGTISSLFGELQLQDDGLNSLLLCDKRYTASHSPYKLPIQTLIEHDPIV